MRMKSAISILLCIALLVLTIPIQIVSAQTVSGEAGETSTWTLDLDTGVMTFSGTGRIDGNYKKDDANGTPAVAYKENVRHIIIEDGITIIQERSFRVWESLTTVDMGNTVTAVLSYAFEYTPQLSAISVSDTLEYLSYGAFASTGLTHIDLPASLEWIGPGAFANNRFSYVAIPENVTCIDRACFQPSDTLKAVIIKSKKLTVDAHDDAYSFTDVLPYFSDNVEDVVILSADFNLEYTHNMTESTSTIHYAPAGGAVEAYCLKYGFPFCDLNTKKLGDVDDSGDVNTVDTRLMLNNILGEIPTNSITRYLSDANSDGDVNTLDVRHMLSELIKA